MLPAALSQHYMVVIACQCMGFCRIHGSTDRCRGVSQKKPWGIAESDGLSKIFPRYEGYCITFWLILMGYRRIVSCPRATTWGNAEFPDSPTWGIAEKIDSPIVNTWGIAEKAPSKFCNTPRICCFHSPRHAVIRLMGYCRPRYWGIEDLDNGVLQNLPSNQESRLGYRRLHTGVLQPQTWGFADVFMGYRRSQHPFTPTAVRVRCILL